MVYVVGPRPNNRELRWSLRSLSAHVPHGRVWIAGHKPNWVTGVGHIPVAQFGSRWANARANLRAACTHPDLSQAFVFMNDDFFVMEPVSAIPVAHRGPLADVAARIPMGSYRSGAVATMRLLHALGVDNPVSYDLHTPMVMDKAALLAAMGLPAARRIPVLHTRTLYGNLARLGGVQVPDVKIHGPGGGLPPGPLVSTAPAAFDGAAGRAIRAAFPTPCRYEKEDY